MVRGTRQEPDRLRPQGIPRGTRQTDEQIAIAHAADDITPRLIDARLIDTDPLDIFHQLALDAALLASVHEQRGAPGWRFWEPSAPAVVVGTGSRVARDVHVEHARADGVPIVRRVSGGGSVLQAPGVLNFTAVLPVREDDLGSQSIRQCFLHVLGAVIEALNELGLTADFEPPSDLAGGGRKIAGNAQARKRRAYMVHGAILVSADVSRFDRYLRHPPDEPAYRRGRAHAEFVTTLSDLGVEISPGELARRIARAAGLDEASAEPPADAEWRDAQRLAVEKFTSDAWNLRK